VSAVRALRRIRFRQTSPGQVTRVSKHWGQIVTLLLHFARSLVRLFAVR